MRSSLTRKQYIRKSLRGKRYTGSWLVLLGWMTLLLWSLTEFAIRYDAMDGVLEAYFGLVRDGDITLHRALEKIWETKEAVKDLTVLVVLAVSALISVVSALFHDSHRFTVISLVFAMVICAYDPYDSWFAFLFNLSTVIRIAGCALVLAGSVLKITSVTSAKLRAGMKYDKAHKKAIPSTRIPQRSSARR